MFHSATSLFFIFAVCGIGSMLAACSDNRPSDRPAPDIPPENIEIVRFDQILCRDGHPSENRSLDSLLQQFPVFTDVFFNQVIFPQGAEAIQLEDLVRNYCGAPAIQHLIDTTKIIFPNLNKLEIELGQALGYFHHYFPDRPIPRVVTYVSEFGIGTFTVDTEVLGIGLDFFLGSQYPYYDPAVFPNYMVRTMTPEYLSVKAVRAIAQVLLPPVTTGNFLEYMIHHGKTLYIASRLQPRMPMSSLCLFTEEEMKWVEENELPIWSFLVDLDYFYETDPRKFQKYVDPAPHTPGLPSNAPGRVANWIGYRIVESYMFRNNQVTLAELAAETDYQKIMDQSGYKPPRPKR